MHHWEEGGHLPSFDGSFVGQGEAAAMHQSGPHPPVMEGGEVPINIIEQTNLQPELMFYQDGSPIPPGEIVNGAFCGHDISAMALHSELHGSLLPPPLFPTHKPKGEYGI